MLANTQGELGHATTYRLVKHSSEIFVYAYLFNGDHHEIQKKTVLGKITNPTTEKREVIDLGLSIALHAPSSMMHGAVPVVLQSTPLSTILPLQQLSCHQVRHGTYSFVRPANVGDREIVGLPAVSLVLCK